MSTAAHPHAILAALSLRGLLDLVDDVCARHGVTPQELCGRRRTQAVVGARHELWWLIRHHPDRHYSLAELGLLFGRDHSTIKCALDTFQRRSPHRSP
jgi:chromosomal replication initiation ATPase DnaA